jgi:hypothetical protein
MPVPPQAPQAPQGQPPQGSQPPQAPQEGDIGKLVGGIFDGLDKLQSVMESAKVPPNITQRLQQVIAEYQAIIEALQGGGEDEGQEMSPKGPVSEEMGAGNATPM